MKCATDQRTECVECTGQDGSSEKAEKGSRPGIMLGRRWKKRTKRFTCWEHGNRCRDTLGGLLDWMPSSYLGASFRCFQAASGGLGRWGRCEIQKIGRIAPVRSEPPLHLTSIDCSGRGHCGDGTLNGRPEKKLELSYAT